MDEREERLRRAAIAGDEDAAAALRVSEFRRGARQQTLFLLAPDDATGILHLVCSRGAYCGLAGVGSRVPESMATGALVVNGEERWGTWAGPDDSLDEGRCNACHGRALRATREVLFRLFCWQIAKGRLVQNRHPDDNVEHWHPITGRDLKPDEHRPCVSCSATGVYDYGHGEQPCGTCSGRGWNVRSRL